MIRIFGIIGFVSVFALGMIEFSKNSENFATLLFYGTLVFFLNIFYIKLIILSREDYEDKLKKEKDYSQNLVKSQKLFLRHAVHETNTPLAVIMANIELFELESGKHSALSNIEAATKNIYGIYDDLSYLARKDKVSYVKQEIVLTDFIKNRVEFFDIVAKQSKLSFEFKNSCKKSTVFINKTKLQRIVDNNITNAIKYTKSFEVVNIILHESNGYCVLEITSNSTIIENPEEVFDEFYRENRVKDGLGVGLNLVKSICDEENIRISLKSDKNRTSFKYYFKKGVR